MATDPETLMDKAAVVLCEIRGKDPYEMISVNKGKRESVGKMLRWRQAREELVRHNQRDLAFETAVKRVGL